MYFTDVRGAAWLLNLRESTIYERMKRGVTQYRMFGKHYLIPFQEIEKESGLSHSQILERLRINNLAIWGEV